ncbi:DUF4192 domain-containing protein [Janibacter cremeus]|uniref:DUF4192 domain-containing protein n=1 Tax=Janibacter cremeus TaxID=1285192 RepID=UPI0023F7935D|nr:DUF4192 domain-containing protein [Janibacter cremeus]WEV78635.1 DUF4192 domain-containing protein [Janibacter cremeus]
MTTTVRPRNPAELAVVLPYQLGYHPGPSVVVTVLHGKRLGLVQRHDLLSDPEDCRGAAGQAMAIAARESATAVMVIAHEDRAGDSAPLSEAMLEAATAEGISVHDRVVVRDGRWYSPDCAQSCCPEEGQPLPRPEDVPAVAAFVHAGVAPLPSRAAIVEGVLPGRDEDRARSVGLHLAALGSPSSTRTFGGGPTGPPASWLDRGEDVLAWWAQLLDPRPRAMAVTVFSDEALARVATSLRDVVWRDALLGVLCPGAMPMAESCGAPAAAAVLAARWCPWVPDVDIAVEDVAAGIDEERARASADVSPERWHEEVLAVRSRLVELSRLLPPEATPPVLTLVAHLAWWVGDGTVAGICLERALEIEPDHRLAELMLRLLSAGVRPWAGALREGASGEAA